jgi:type II secretory pathway pseudopilin PulG
MKEHKFFWPKLDRAGMSLTEVMIAAGLSTGVALGVAQIMQHASRTAKSTQATVDFTQLTSQVQMIINDELACKQVFRNVFLDPSNPATSKQKDGISIDGAITNLTIGEAGSLKTIVKKMDKPVNGLKVTSMEFVQADVTPGKDGNPLIIKLKGPDGGRIDGNEYQVTFRISAAKELGGGGSQVGLKNLDKDFVFWVAVDKATGQIMQCRTENKQAETENICQTINAPINDDGTCSLPCPPNAHVKTDGESAYKTCVCDGKDRKGLRHAAFDRATWSCVCPVATGLPKPLSTISSSSAYALANIVQDSAGNCDCENITGLANPKEDSTGRYVPFTFGSDGGVASDGSTTNSGGGIFCACPGFLKVEGSNHNIVSNWRESNKDASGTPLDKKAFYLREVVQGSGSSFSCSVPIAGQTTITTGNSPNTYSAVCQKLGSFLDTSASPPTCQCKGDLNGNEWFRYLISNTVGGANYCGCVANRVWTWPSETSLDHPRVIGPEDIISDLLIYSAYDSANCQCRTGFTPSANGKCCRSGLLYTSDGTCCPSGTTYVNSRTDKCVTCNGELVKDDEIASDSQTCKCGHNQETTKICTETGNSISCSGTCICPTNQWGAPPGGMISSNWTCHPCKDNGYTNVEGSCGNRWGVPGYSPSIEDKRWHKLAVCSGGGGGPQGYRGTCGIQCSTANHASGLVASDNGAECRCPKGQYVGDAKEVSTPLCTACPSNSRWSPDTQGCYTSAMTFGCSHDTQCNINPMHCGRNTHDGYWDTDHFCDSDTGSSEFSGTYWDLHKK